jgi:hypothetical protein
MYIDTHYLTDVEKRYLVPSICMSDSIFLLSWALEEGYYVDIECAQYVLERAIMPPRALSLICRHIAGSYSETYVKSKHYGRSRCVRKLNFM